MKPRALVSILLIIYPLSAAIAAVEAPADTIRGSNLGFGFGSISFFRNNEFYNPITRGYTLTGSQLRPVLIWRPADNVEVKGGAFVSIWSGYDGSPLLKPVFSTSFSLAEGIRLTVGSLDGSDSHNMFDPHYDSEKLYSDFQEEGFRFLISRGRFTSDTWIDWERFIFTGDNHREELTFGESLRYTAGREDGNVRVEFPVQVIARHYGGDISDYSEPVETHINAAGGARVVIGERLNQKRITGIEATGFIYGAGRDPSDIDFSKGSAFWLRADHTRGDLFVSAGIWFSDNFHSPNGNRIYGSISDFQPGVSIAKRTLLSGSLNFTKGVQAGLVTFLQGFDWYYDIREGRIDYTLTLHIRINEKAYWFKGRDQ